MKGHIITPEGVEVASTRSEWEDYPDDWKSLAAFFECEGCPAEVGSRVDHPARGPYT